MGSVFGLSISLVLLALLFFVAAANSFAGMASSVSARILATFTAAVLVAMLVVRAWGALGVARMEISLSLDKDRVFAGETLALRARIANRKPLPVWMRLKLAFPEALKAHGAQGETGLMPYERVDAEWLFTAARRGVYTLGPATLVAGDLLGLYQKERVLSFKRHVVVYPPLAPIPDLAPPLRECFGIHPSKGLIEDPAWYEGSREYLGTRSAKHIHWKASARLGILQEKIFAPTSHLKVFLLLSSTGFRGLEERPGFETAIETLATLASRFAEAGASFALAVDCGVDAFPAVLPLGRGPEHLGKTLELLARCVFSEGRALEALVKDVHAAGFGYVVVARRGDSASSQLRDLPSSKRDRLLFYDIEAPA